MISYRALRLRDGSWCVGYQRPTEPGAFLVMVSGFDTEPPAAAEARRLNADIASRTLELAAELNEAGVRRTISGFYDDGAGQ